MSLIGYLKTRLVLGLLLAMVLLCVGAPTASANGGPIVSPGSHGSIITPKGDTDIWVNHEALRFRLSYGLTTAGVEAVYSLENRGAAAEKTRVAFIYVGDGELPLTVASGGQPVEAATQTIDELLAPRVGAWLDAHPQVRTAIPDQSGSITIDDKLVAAVQRALEAEGVHASQEDAADILWFAYGISGPWHNSTVAAARLLLPAEYGSLTANWVDPEPLFLNPITGRPYAPKYASELEGGEVRFGEFDIALDPGEERELRISYTQPAAVDRESVVAAWLRFAPISNYRYFLQPAKHWAGFGDLEISVIAPLLVHTASSVPLRRTGWLGANQVLEASLGELPRGDLVMAFKRRSILGIPLVLSNLPWFVLISVVAWWTYRRLVAPAMRSWLRVLPGK